MPPMFRELAPGTVSLTGDRAQGDDSKHWAYSTPYFSYLYKNTFSQLYGLNHCIHFMGTIGK